MILGWRLKPHFIFYMIDQNIIRYDNVSTNGTEKWDDYGTNPLCTNLFFCSLLLIQKSKKYICLALT